MIETHSLQSAVEILSGLNLNALERDLLEHYLNELPLASIERKHDLTAHEVRRARTALFEKCRAQLWSNHVYSVGDIEIPEQHRTLEGRLSHKKTFDKKTANKLSHRKARANKPRKPPVTKKMLKGLQVVAAASEPLNITKLAQEIGVSRQTLTIWLAPTHRFRQAMDERKNAPE